MQRVNLYDELVVEGAELDITTVFVKIGGYPPLVLRPLRKTMLSYSGIDSLSKFSITALRELPTRIPDSAAPAPVDGVDGAAMQTVLYGYVAPGLIIKGLDNQTRKRLIISDNQAFDHVSPNFSELPVTSPGLA